MEPSLGNLLDTCSYAVRLNSRTVGSQVDLFWERYAYALDYRHAALDPLAVGMVSSYTLGGFIHILLVLGSDCGFDPPTLVGTANSNSINSC